MEIQTNTNHITPGGFPMKPSRENLDSFHKMNDLKNFFHEHQIFSLNDLWEKLTMPVGKKSFLVCKNHKYMNVPTENIAFFYVKYESSIIVGLDEQEYFVNHSLEQIQNSLSEKQFFRLNRQYLVNFNAIKEVEYYFARKLLVNLVVPVKDKILVSKERVTTFLHWLDNR
jgi:DNA-binding LytR/AlgR family response regulator